MCMWKLCVCACAHVCMCQAGGASSAPGETSPTPAPNTCCAPLQRLFAVGMFQVGRASIPKPAAHSLEDLDSVQRVLLHRSVLGRGIRRKTSLRSRGGWQGEGRPFLPGSCRERLLGFFSVRSFGWELSPSLHPFQNRVPRIHPIWSRGVYLRAGPGYPLHCKIHHFLTIHGGEKPSCSFNTSKLSPELKKKKKS